MLKSFAARSVTRLGSGCSTKIAIATRYHVGVFHRANARSRSAPFSTRARSTSSSQPSKITSARTRAAPSRTRSRSHRWLDIVHPYAEVK